MRISPISVSHARNYQKLNVQRQNAQIPNFKGGGGAVGTMLGAGAGLLITFVTGGAFAWAIPALSGVGTIGGDIYEHTRKPVTDDDEDYDDDFEDCRYDDSSCYINYRDY